MTATIRPSRAWRWLNMAFGIIGLSFASVICAPQLLAFPYQAQVGATRVYAETPLNQMALRMVLGRADARLATSPLYRPPVGTRIFLTDGGWRWRLLALNNSNALGLTRPVSDMVSDAVIIHRGDVASDQIATAYGPRLLSGVIAHERTHIMVRRHVGLIGGVRLPTWISEGYADHIAGESTLNAAQAAALTARGDQGRGLFYYHARRRVAAALAANGGHVDALLGTK
jgi:hypothetical protein